MRKTLDNKIVLITGGARGIGYHLATLCATAGATVLIADIDNKNLSLARRNLKKLIPTGESYEFDVANPNSCKALAKKIHQKYGALDILVNNAGIVRKGNLLDAKSKDWDDTLKVNVNGMIYMIKAFVPKMLEKENTQVINVASILGFIPMGSATVYVASKHAVIGLTDSLREEMRSLRQKIQITLVCPGFTDTGMFYGLRTPWFVRAAEPLTVAEHIFKGIIKRKNRVVYPRKYSLLPLLYALVPQFIWNNVNHCMGIHTAMKTVDIE